MRRLLVTCEFPPIIGGQGSYFLNLWSDLKNMGDILLVPRQCYTFCQQIRSSNFDYVTLPVSEQWSDRFIRLGRLLIKVFWISIMKKPSALHFGQLVVGGICGFIIRTCLRIPYIVHCHGADILEFSRYWWMRIILYQVLNTSQCIIANSRYTVSCIKKLYQLKTKIVVINPSVSSHFFTHNPNIIERIRGQYNLHNKKVILTTGRLVERKGHDLVLQSLVHLSESIPNILYLIVGQGPYLEQLKAITQKNQLQGKVIFCHNVSQEDLPSYYRVASLFVMVPRLLKNTGNVEGFGIVYLEANAAGIPVIASKSGGVEDAVKDGFSGLLINDPGDSTELAKTIKTVLLNKKYYYQLAQNATIHAQQFTQEIQKKNWLEAINSPIEHGSPYAKVTVL